MEIESKYKKIIEDINKESLIEDGFIYTCYNIQYLNFAFLEKGYYDINDGNLLMNLEQSDLADIARLFKFGKLRQSEKRVKSFYNTTNTFDNFISLREKLSETEKFIFLKALNNLNNTEDRKLITNLIFNKNTNLDELIILLQNLIEKKNKNQIGFKKPKELVLRSYYL